MKHWTKIVRDSLLKNIYDIQTKPIFVFKGKFQITNEENVVKA